MACRLSPELPDPRVVLHVSLARYTHSRATTIAPFRLGSALGSLRHCALCATALEDRQLEVRQAGEASVFVKPLPSGHNWLIGTLARMSVTVFQMPGVSSTSLWHPMGRITCQPSYEECPLGVASWSLLDSFQTAFPTKMHAINRLCLFVCLLASLASCFMHTCPRPSARCLTPCSA